MDAAGSLICLWIVGAYIQAADPAKTSSERLASDGIAASFFFYLPTAFYTPIWNGTPVVINCNELEAANKT
ncbi:hypothetical protein N7451_008586 [Penicillium sp. IBT 35674x]|nr:hypothetical protein N7451_008586 [Penicillium sp. IBT 35674x]